MKLTKYIQKKQMQLFADDLIKATEKQFLIPSLKDKNNTRLLVYCRTVIVMILHEKYPKDEWSELYPVSRRSIAKVFGRGDSDFVYHCITRHEANIRYKDYAEIYNVIKTL